MSMFLFLCSQRTGYETQGKGLILHTALTFRYTKAYFFKLVFIMWKWVEVKTKEHL